MLNKLTARSERIQPIIAEILWLAAAFDVEIHYACLRWNLWILSSGALQVVIMSLLMRLAKRNERLMLKLKQMDNLLDKVGLSGNNR